jgi:hypothetical protein
MSNGCVAYSTRSSSLIDLSYNEALSVIWVHVDLDNQLLIRICQPGVNSRVLKTSQEVLIEKGWPAKIKSHMKDEWHEVRMLASCQNYGLAAELEARKEELKISNLLLHRPSLKEEAPPSFPAGITTFADFTSISTKLAGEDLPLSVGGPRKYRHDVDSLTFAASKHKSPDDHSWIEEHPAWPGISFFRAHSLTNPQVVEDCVRLIGLIGDPRWYVDPERPDTSKGLMSAFGLGRNGESNATAFITGEGEQRNFHHFSVVARATCGRFARDDGDESEERASAILASARFHLRLICSVWLDNLTPARRYERAVSADGKPMGPSVIKPGPPGRYSRQLFVPAYEFPETTVPDWHIHIENWRKKFNKN